MFVRETLCPILSAFWPNVTQYEWNYQGNTVGNNNDSLQTTFGGTYILKVSTPSGCQGSDTINVNVIDLNVDLGGNLAFCDNAPIPDLDAGYAGLNYQWSIDGNLVANTNQTQSILASGSYAVTVSTASGCQSSDSVIVQLQSALIADFNMPASAIMNSSVNFTDQSTPSPTSLVLGVLEMEIMQTHKILHIPTKLQGFLRHF